MSSKVINLRPHHFLCIRFFTGHGYSEAFTQNMYKTIKALKDGIPVNLCCGLDDLCMFCPNNTGSKCKSEEKVTRYDNAVLSLFPSVSFPLEWNKIQSLVDEYIMNTNKFDTVCADCQWSYLCR